MVLGLAVALLAGCSASEAGPTTTPATTVKQVMTEATTTPRLPLPPVLPAAAAKPDQAGAEAFFRYFWDVYNWSYMPMDPTQLQAISSPECDFCARVTTDLRQGAAKRLTTEGGVVTVKIAVAGATPPEIGLPIVATIDQTAATQTDADGKVVTSGPAIRDRRIDARVVWMRGQWRLAAITKGAQ